MTSLYGVANPAMQRALVELCFCSPSPKNLAMLDEAIQTDSLSGEQLRILPLIYKHAPVTSLSDFTQSRLRGIYKHTLYRNHLILNKAKKIACDLHHEGFGDPMFLKGIPSVMRGQDALGKRPMADLDILIPDLISKLETVMQFIRGNGFKVIGSNIRSVTIIDSDGFEYDLHWHLNNWALRKDTVNQLFTHGTEIAYQDHNYIVPCIEHHLVHTLAHGMLTPSLVYEGRWAVDALDILTSMKDLDHEKFASLANSFLVPGSVRQGLDMIISEVPKEIQLEHLRLKQLALQLNKSSIMLGSLYSQPSQPEPTSPGSARPARRIDWYKLVIRYYLIEPLVLLIYNRRSFPKSVGAIFSFPPCPLLMVIPIILKRLITRLPYAVLGIWSRRKAEETMVKVE